MGTMGYACNGNMCSYDRILNKVNYILLEVRPNYNYIPLFCIKYKYILIIYVFINN